MSTTERQHHQQQQSRPREPSLDDPAYASLNYPKPDSTVGAKRLFSDREARRRAEQDENAAAQTALDDEDTPTTKRYRSAEWPLAGLQAVQNASQARAPLRNRNAQHPASHGRRLSPPNRSSKFVEGSMRDRVSYKPPVPYLDDEDEHLSQYDAGVGGRASALSSRGESSRNPIFRFGKSIASTFNPTNWKIWSKDKHAEDEDEETAQAKSMRESKEKAERIYRELKESGRFRDAAHVTQNVYQPTHPSPSRRISAKHDSGVEFGENESTARSSREVSRDDRRTGRVFLEPPSFPPSVQSHSPTSNISGSMARSDTSSPSKRSVMLKKGSLSNLNGHFRKPSLTNIKKSFLGESRESLAYSSTTDLHRPARRIPSRKDLQKQQRLVKRVSDLEGKLEAARRQLSDALGEPVPALPAAPAERLTRSRFVPGALASLPSERLLSGYVDPDDNVLDDTSSVQTHNCKNAPTMSGARGNSLLRTDSLQQDVILPSVENESHSKDSQETREKRISQDSLLTAATLISRYSTNASDLNDGEGRDDGGEELGGVADNEATPKASRAGLPGIKRKSAFAGLADDGSSYKPSEEEDETDESEISKNAAKPNPPKVPAGLSRPNKLQKTTPAAPASKVQTSPQNSRVSGSRIQGPARGRSIQAFANAISDPPTRKLSKSHPSAAQKNPQQSVNSPPSSPTFMGMKPERSSSNIPKYGSRTVTPPSGRINPHNLVYSADPDMESDVPPMPPMPKSVRLANGEVISTASPGTSPLKHQPQAAHVAHKRLTKSKTPSPRKLVRKSFEWPEDVF